MAVDLRQTHFRFGKDDGTEVTHTFWENEDTNHTQNITDDWSFLLRFTEQEAGGTAAANIAAQFQYNLNGAGWVDITTTSSVVRAVAVDAFADGNACTKRLSGSGTFETSGAGCTEDGLSGGAANDIAASGNSETEAGLQAIYTDIFNGNTIQFRFTAGAVPVSYDVTPTLTITKPSEREILRPNAAGDETAIGIQFPASGSHWDKVDESIADDDTTFVAGTSVAYQRDLYNLPPHSVGSGSVNFMSIYLVKRAIVQAGYYQYSQKSGTAVTDSGDYLRSADDYGTTSLKYTTNPATGIAYTWGEIDALQIGVSLKTAISGGTIRCTQVYTEVDYTLPSTYECSASDGIKSADTNKGNMNFNLSISEGLKSGDTNSKQYATAPINLDGLKASDSLVTQADLQSLISDGISLSDALAHLYEANPSVLDGTKLGDIPLTQAVLGSLVVDGLKLSDIPLTQAILNALSSDGTKLSDITDAWRAFYVSLIDGAKTGDTLSHLYESNPILADEIKLGDLPTTIAMLNLLLEDGTKLGDIPIGNLITTLLAIDGTKLSDISVTLLNFYLSLMDSSKISDLPTTTSILNTPVSDSAKVGDLSTIYATLNLVGTDNLKISEIISTLLQGYPSIIEGAKLNDLILVQGISNLLLSDSIKLSDVALARCIYQVIAGDGLKISDTSEAILSIFIALTLLKRSIGLLLQSRTTQFTLPNRRRN